MEDKTRETPVTFSFVLTNIHFGRIIKIVHTSAISSAGRAADS